MAGFVNTRRNHIRRRGRSMELRRLTSTTAYTSVSLLGILRAYRPEQLAGDIRQGDAQVSVLADEIAAASWPAPPRVRDQLVIDAMVWAVQGAWPIFDGSSLIGWDLWVRGGA
jgi:hypothetical protein